MSIIAAVFLLLALLTLSVPIPSVPPHWRLALIFSLTWFILFALEKGGMVRFP